MRTIKIALFLIVSIFTIGLLFNDTVSTQKVVVLAQDEHPTPTPTPTPTPNPIIVWNKDRPLTWDDFKGPVPENDKGLSAESVVGVHSTWKTETKTEPVGKSGKVKCTATITQVNAQAEFDPNTSWVKPDKQTPELLKHEQGHFNISEFFARKKKKQMEKFVGQSESAVADDEKKACEEADGKIEKKLMEICDAIDKEEDAMQNAYDTQTKHGTDAEKQKKWDEKIAKMLEEA